MNWNDIKAKLKGWRTLIWNGFIASAGAIIATLDQLKQVDWTQFVTGTRVALIAVGLGVVGIWLRLVTTGPVGDKQ